MGCGSSVERDVSLAGASEDDLHFVTNPTSIHRALLPEAKRARRRSVVVFVDQPSAPPPESPNVERRQQILRQDSDLVIHSVHSSCVQHHISEQMMEGINIDTSEPLPSNDIVITIEPPHITNARDAAVFALPPASFAELPDTTCCLCHQWCGTKPTLKTPSQVIFETSFGEPVESMGPSLTPSRRSSVTMHWPSDSENNLRGCVLSSMERMDAEIAALDAELQALETCDQE